MALYQAHTFSVDDGSAKIELERPRCWDDQEKEATLKVITPAEVHPDLFKGSTKPLHIHVSGSVCDIPIDQFPTFTSAHKAPPCASMSNMAADKHPRDAADHMAAIGANASEKSKHWDAMVVCDWRANSALATCHCCAADLLCSILFSSRLTFATSHASSADVTSSRA